jgi:cytoskeletal protein CcmA (bactofilin family)
VSKKKTSVVIDPIQMNITNKISKGSILSGDVSYEGGVLIEGSFSGKMKVVGGPLVLGEGATLRGDIDVSSDAYIFGTLDDSDEVISTLRVHGELHLTSKCVIHGSVFFHKLATYHGAKINGSMQSIDTSAIN